MAPVTFVVCEQCCEGVEQLAGMSLQNAVRLDTARQVGLSLA